MGNNDFTQKLENLRQQVDELQKHAEKKRTQLEAALPDVLKNLQDALEELQTYDSVEGVSREIAGPTATCGAIEEDTDNGKASDEVWKKYEFIVNTSQEFMTLISNDYLYKAVNDAYCKAHDRTREEIIDCSVADVWGEEIFDTVIKKHLDECFAGNEIHYQCWLEFVSLGRRYFDIAYYPFYNDEGIVTDIIVVSRDITKRKLAEDELCQYRNNLVEMVEERTSELTQANNQLQDEIAQREQIEEALRESENRYQQLVETVTDYIYSVKVENGQPITTDHGPGCVAVTGYMPQEYKADPNLWYKMIHQEDQKAALEQATKVLSGEEVVPLEHRIIHKNGSTRWVKNTPVPRYDEQGHLIAYDGLIADISDRKQLESFLRESEAKFRALAETTAAAIFIFRESYNLYVNPAAEAITGYSEEELLKMKYWEVIHPEFQDLVKARGLSRQRGKDIPSRYELKILTKGGEVRWVESTLGIIEFEGKSTTLGTAFDITDRKQAEAEREHLLLAEREQRILAETLGEVFLALVARTSLKAVLDEILYQLHRVISFSAANIMLLEDGMLHVVRHQGYKSFGSSEFLSTLEQSVAEFPLDASAIQSRQIVVVADTHQEPDWVAMEGASWIRSFVAIPICLHERVLGLLRLDSETPNNFLSNDVEGLRPLANAAAIALENAKLYDQARQEIAKRVVQVESEIIQLNRQLLALQYAGARLTSGLDPQDMLDSVIKEMTDLLKVDGCALFEWDPETNIVSLLTKYGLDRRWEEGSLVEVYSSTEFHLIERVLVERRPQQITISHPDLYHAELAYIKEANLRTLLVVPMEFQDKVIGLLQLMDAQSKRTFTNREIGLAQLLGNQIASAIENTRLYKQVQQEIAERQHAEQETRKLNAKLITLQKAGAVITASLDLQYILETVSKEMTRLLDVEGCALFKWDATTNTMSVMTRYGLSTWSDESSPIDIHHWADYPLIKQVIAERQVQQITLGQSDKASAELTYMQWRKIKALLIQPMEYQDHLVGLIEIVDSRMERTFTPDEIAVIQLLANQAASAIENARLFENAQKELVERMQAERELRRVAARRQAILNAIPDSMIYLNRKGKILSYKLVDNRHLPAGIAMPVIVGNSGNFLEASLDGLIKHHIDKAFDSGKPQSFEYQLAGSERVQDFEVRLVVSDPNEVLAIIRNITKQKRAEKGLAEERNLLRTVIDNVPDYIFAKDVMGQYLVNNKAHIHLLGVQTSDEVVGKTADNFFTPKEAKRLTSDDDMVIQAGQPLLNKEGVINNKDGDEIWRSISKVPLRNNQGKIIGLVSIGRDITERKRMEEALLKSETNLRAIFENSRQAFVLADREHTLQAFNRIAKIGIRLVSGKTIKEGGSVFDYVPETDLDEFNRSFNKALNGKSVRQEKQVNLRDIVKWFEISYNPVFADNGQVIGVCFSAIDIDERKRAVDELAASEMRLWEEMRSMLATTRALVSEININNLLEFIMSQAMALMDADQTAVLLLSDDGQYLDIANPTASNLGIRKDIHLPIQGSLAGLALASQQIQISNDVDDPSLLAPILSFLQLSNVHSLLCAPLIFQRNRLGVLLAWNRNAKIFSKSDNHMVEIFADQAALALYNAELHAQNRLLAIEQERHRMARDLHDSVTQSLYSIGLAAQTSMRLLGQDKVTEAQDPLDYVHMLSQAALAEMREQIYHLRPTDLDKEDLVEVLRRHCNTLGKVYGLDMKFIDNLQSLPPTDQREALYFIAREALWNVIKHASAKQVNITLHSVNKYIRLTIEDDGIGLDPSRIQRPDRMGLRNMQERTRLLGGTFDLKSEPGLGTRLTVQIPH